MKLSKREQLIVLEIGSDRIDTASGFVNYMEESYGFSKSSVWYNLNRLKEKKVLDFASKERHGEPLALTKAGMSSLGTVRRGNAYNREWNAPSIGYRVPMMVSAKHI
ncbi:MAG: hypothetical protein KGH98_04995 [Candidatus Micrarchaeota archaeon]|nr:hypothetical protein [Candidatus Micrarchaeota archaeon]